MSRLLAAALCASLGLLPTGCTHRQLARSTALTAGTVVDIQYETVLNNLARMHRNSCDLPSHIDLADGTIQVSDEASFGRAGGFDVLPIDGGFGIDRLGPAAGRQVSEQWGADATTDPQRLVDLQDLYRAAMGLPPLPPPTAIALLRKEDERSGRNLAFTTPGAAGASGAAGLPDGLAAPGSSGDGDEESDETENGSDSDSEDDSDDGSGRKVPIEVLLSDVPPPGWYGVGCKRDVPKCACHVGRCGDTYVWVTPDGLPSLSRFTVTVLAVVKFKPGPSGGGGGLAVTP